jgi:hypothetical protein
VRYARKIGARADTAKFYDLNFTHLFGRDRQITDVDGPPLVRMVADF